MSEENIKTLSPVAVMNNMNKNKKLNSFIFMGLTSVIVFGGMYLLHRPEKHEDVQAESVKTTTTNYVAPEIVSKDKQVQEVETLLNNQNTDGNNNIQEESEAEKLEKMRMVAPTTVYSASNAEAQNSQISQANTPVLGNGKGDENTQFMAQLSASSAPIATASHIAHPDTTLAQGTMIWATLETRIVSDLPNMIRAITSEDIYSEDGSRILLPRGSKLIGQYTNGILQGQERVFAVWQRVIRPDHIDVQLNSPAADSLGAGGIEADSIDHHFFAQFGQSILLSIISAGTANTGVSPEDQFNSASAYREALATSFAQTSENTLHATGIINPTLKINQGKAISVFVARDLDFYNELNASRR